MEVSDKIHLSFVIPIYNEAERLPSSLHEILSFQTSLKDYTQEWLFVVEPSKDKSLSIVKNFCSENTNTNRLIANTRHKGKGYAVQQGMLQAKGDICFFMDADLATPLYEVNKFLNAYKSDTSIDILIGSRKSSDSKIKKRQAPHRLAASFVLKVFLKTLKLDRFDDTQCGFKAFKKHTVHDLFYDLFTMGFAFDLEILAKAVKKNYKIKSIGVSWADQEGSTLSLWRDAKKIIKEIYIIKRHLS